MADNFCCCVYPDQVAFSILLDNGFSKLFIHRNIVQPIPGLGHTREGSNVEGKNEAFYKNFISYLRTHPSLGPT